MKFLHVFNNEAIRATTILLLMVLPTVQVHADDTDVFYAVSDQTAEDAKTNIMFIMDEASSMSNLGQFTFDPISCNTTTQNSADNKNSFQSSESCYDPNTDYHHPNLSPGDDNYMCYNKDEWYFLPRNDLSRVRADYADPVSLRCKKNRADIMATLRADRGIDPTTLVKACNGLEDAINTTGGQVGWFMGLYDRLRSDGIKWYPGIGVAGNTNEIGWYPIDVHGAGSFRDGRFWGLGGLKDPSKIRAIECLADAGVHGKDATSTKKYASMDIIEGTNGVVDINSAWGNGTNHVRPSFNENYGGIYKGNYLNFIRYKTKQKRISRYNTFKNTLKRYIERSKNLRLGLASFKQGKHWGGRGRGQGKGDLCVLQPFCRQRGNSDGGNIDVPVFDLDKKHPNFMWFVDQTAGNGILDANLPFGPSSVWPAPRNTWWNDRDVKHREWLWAKVDEYFTTRAYAGHAKGVMPGLGTTPAADGVDRKDRIYLPRLEMGGGAWADVAVLSGSTASYVPYRPLGETLFEVGRYFKGEPVKFGAYSRPETWTPYNRWGSGDGMFVDGWGWSSGINTVATRYHEIYPGNGKSSKTYQSPIDTECQANAVVIFTDYSGEKKGIDGFNEERNQASVNGIKPPYNDHDEGALMESLWPGLNCSTSIQKYGTCLPSVAKYLHDTDLNTSLSGDQILRTYVVSYWDSLDFPNGREPAGIAMLRETARNGGGKFIRFGADLVELDQAIGKVLNLVGMNPISSGTFVAPASTVDLSSRLQNKDDIYYSLFEPSEQNRWQGNLKRYKLQFQNGELKVVNGTCTTTNCTVAVDANNKFTNSSESAWSSSDGRDIKKGGSSGKQVDPRNVLTDYGLTTRNARLAKITDGGSTGLFKLNTLTNVQAQELAAKFGIEVTLSLQNDVNLLKRLILRRIRYAMGFGVDKDADTSTFYRRVGDPLHSQPKVVPYKNGTGSKDTVVFFGTNEGYLHAIDTSNGKEIFSFLPEHAYAALGAYYENDVSNVGSKVYGFDGEIEVWINDLNGNGFVKDALGNTEAGEGVYLFVGMRRGGTAYYALDVTNVNKPKLMWKIEREQLASIPTSIPTGAAQKFYELGQSWSKPTVIKTKFNGKEKPFLVISGGYDEARDDVFERGVDSKGRAIYILDATTGERKWTVGYKAANAQAINYNAFNVTNPEMKYSFPATPAVIDANGDTYIDTIIAADSGGQIWRVDINNDNSGASDFATVDLIAKLADDKNVSPTAARPNMDNRKFFVTPDLMVDSSGAERSLMIALGSGRRPEPLDRGVEDHFYVLRSTPAIGPKMSPNGIVPRVAITLSDLLDATDDNAYSSGASNNALQDFNKNGFYIRLGQKLTGNDKDVGEKVITEASIFNGYVVFASYIPSDKPEKCGEALGSNRFNAINYNNPDSRYVADLAQKGIAPKPSILILNDGTKRKPALVIGTEVFDKPDMPDPLKNLYTLSRDKLIRFWVEDK